MKTVFVVPISIVCVYGAIPFTRFTIYCIYGYEKIMNILTINFSWILSFCFSTNFKRIKIDSLYPPKERRKQKLQYLWEAYSSNVREVGTFFDTCLNVGQVFLYNFKTLYGHFHKTFNQKFMPSLWYMERLEISFRICVKFRPSELVRT